MRTIVVADFGGKFLEWWELQDDEHIAIYDVYRDSNDEPWEIRAFDTAVYAGGGEEDLRVVTLRLERV